MRIIFIFERLLDLVTVQEIAGRLTLIQQTVRSWLDEGRIPYVRVGRRVRIYKHDCDAFLRAAEPGAKP